MQILNSAIFEKPSCKFKFLQREGFNVPNYYELTTIDEVLALYKKYMQSTTVNLIRFSKYFYKFISFSSI